MILAAADQPLPLLSARNRVEGTVHRLVEVDERVFVEVAAPSGTMRAEVTHQAVQELGIADGRPIRCLFKTTALRWGSQICV